MPPATRHNNPENKTVLVLKGFCMGTADVIPGVSGGTMAFILGIYPQLIDGIKSFDRVWLQALFRLQLQHAISRPHLAFLIPLVSGIVLALLFFTRIIPLPQLIHDYPEPVYGLFFGLIAGSIVILLRGMLIHGAGVIVPMLAGTVAGCLMFNLVPLQTPEAAWFIFISGCLAICAMILPGISGSFILLILNKYAFIFDAIGYFRFSVLVPFALGAVTGLVVFSRILSFLLHRYYSNTVLFITGMLLASLWVIWPFQERVYEMVREKPRLIASTPYFPADMSQTVVISALLVITGFLAVLFINRFAMLKTRQTG
jgi:putative membrane protein